MADFIEVNADLHIHGCYAGATSANMVPSIIGEQAKLKGLHLLGTGDILHPQWMKLVKEQLKKVDDGTFEHPNGMRFVLQVEVEDSDRVHHLIIFPSLSKVDEVKEALSAFTSFSSDGRPKVNRNGAEIADVCIDAECLLGFAHAFTPYFGLFSKFDSYAACYGERWRDISFLELGLSADTNMADSISALHNLTFISASDGHSPWPNKLGREFTRFAMKDITFEELAKALRREGGRVATLNVKFNPLEGKYHKTRCRDCLTFFNIQDAKSYRWRCPVCHGTIKKGVVDRVAELTDLPAHQHPPHRPQCIHIIPLAEIIAIAIGTKQLFSEKVKTLWEGFVKRFGSEIDVLINIPIPRLREVNEKIADLIDLFRNDRFLYIPGGAGEYGIPVAPGMHAEMKVWKGNKVERIVIDNRSNINSTNTSNTSAENEISSGQKSLKEFFE